MSTESHKKFCQKLGNTAYQLKEETIETQNEFFKTKLGVSREEIANMDMDEYYKLIESKTGRKMGYQKEIRMDGCKPITLKEKEERIGER